MKEDKDLQEFRKIKPDSKDFDRLNITLRALLFEHTGDWDKAHSLVQNEVTKEAAWVHAYLHRKEGDNGNANYWYAKAERQFSTDSLEEEWKKLALTFL